MGKKQMRTCAGCGREFPSTVRPPKDFLCWNCTHHVAHLQDKEDDELQEPAIEQDWPDLDRRPVREDE